MPKLFDRDNPPDLPPAIVLGLLGEWWQRKQRGRTAAVELPSTGRQTLIETIGEDSLAISTTIACHVEQQSTNNPNDRPSVVGHLQWGTDGSNHNAEFDFCNGVQLCVAGSYVELSAAIDTDAPGNGDPAADPPTFHPVKVFGSIGYIPPSPRVPVRTRYLAFPGAGNAMVTVPAFARDFVVLKSVAAVVVTAEQLDRAGTTLVLETGAGQLSQVLANDCRTVRISVSAAALVRVVFSLYL
jgi:hypothetical protein